MNNTNRKLLWRMFGPVVGFLAYVFVLCVLALGTLTIVGLFFKAFEAIVNALGIW